MLSGVFAESPTTAMFEFCALMARVAAIPSSAGNVDVHQHNVRLQLFSGEDRFLTVGGFADDSDVRAVVQNRAQGLADIGIVIHQEDL
jgi:hypothetical protein